MVILQNKLKLRLWPQLIDRNIKSPIGKEFWVQTFTIVDQIKSQFYNLLRKNENG